MPEIKNRSYIIFIGLILLTLSVITLITNNTVPAAASIVAAVAIAAVTLAGMFILFRRTKQQDWERQSNKTNEALIHLSPFVINIWKQDEQGFEIVSTSKYAAEMFGFSDKNEYVERFYELSPEFQPCGKTSRELAFEVLDKAFSSDEAVKFEWLHQKVDGTPIPTEVTLIRHKLDEAYMVAAYTLDMRPLIEANDLTQLIMDQTPLSIEIWDDTFDLIYCNQWLLDISNVESFAEYKERFDEFSSTYQPDGERSKNKLQALLEKAMHEGYARFGWTHKNALGEPVPYDSQFIRTAWHGENIIIGYSHDLREAKAAMEKADAAEEQSKAKTHFLARISHEIRTPMNSVMGITEIELQKSIHPPETEEAFQRIFNSSRLLLAIINDILDLSKVEAGKMEIINKVYETSSMIADTIQLNLMNMGSKPIDFKLHVDENLPVNLIGDELRIKQILNNLLSNAFKYTDEGHIILKFSFEADNEGNGAILIRIQDTGQGMSEEQVDKLADLEYERFNLTQNHFIEGTGLGLSITYSLLDIMGGSMDVSSKQGKGSTFIIRIPQKRLNDEVLGKEAATNLQDLEATMKYVSRMSVQRWEPMPYGNVLVVDDVETNLYVVKGFLLPYKLHIETATSGYEAVNLIKQGKEYDIIFMDHMMPNLDGIESAKLIWELGYDKPIVALTANATFGASGLFINNGFSGFISKPIDPNKLNEYLINFIKDKQSPEVIMAAEAEYHYSAEEDRDDEIQLRLMESFIVDAEKSIGIIEPLLNIDKMEEEDFRSYTIQTHAMKSALLNIKQNGLSDTAAALEEAGRSKDVEIIKAQTPMLIAELAKLIKDFTNVSNAGNKEDNFEHENRALLSQKLQLISTACEAYDKKSVKAVIKTIDKTTLSAETKSIFSKIDTHLLLSEFEEAAALTKQTAALFITQAQA